MNPDAPELDALRALAHLADTERTWPEASWRLLGQLGATGWSIPVEWGGTGLDRVAQLQGTELLASACLTTTFLFSQREAAVRWLLQASDSIKERYLPPMARGEWFATVGVSQLTTSRQHRPPSLRARAVGTTAYRLDGEIPWVTGADGADALVVGAALDDGQQILLLVPVGLPGLTVEPALPLAALAGSRTAQVRCEGVEVPADQTIAGPGPELVRSGGGVDTSCLALGLARAAIDFLGREAGRRANLGPVVERLGDRLTGCRRRLHELARSMEAEAVLALRIECTRLVLRATQAALAVAKGTGFVVPHPVQRWVRQAQFFLVWSCPQPVASALLADLVGEREA